VLRFRQELLSRWPDLKDVLEPSEFDSDESPKGAQRYVLLTLAVRQLECVPEVIDLARSHGLVGYSGVAGEPIV
jgi:hypothetical protein